MVALSWVMTLTINPRVALLFLVVIPVLGGALIFIAKKAHPHFVKVFDEYDILNNSVQENVNASRVVKSFVREDHEIGKFHDISKYVYRLFTKAEGIVAWNAPVMQTVVYTVIILLVADLRQEYRLWNHGDRRDDKRNRLCHADHDVSYDGNLRICYDHDC